jgi:Tol biopolymer transport system component
MNADGSNQVRLTHNTYMDESPSWSPDGNKIAFDSNRDGNYQIYIMNADGSNQTQLTHDSYDSKQAVWSP